MANDHSFRHLGDPRVSCGPENIEVSANTKLPFEGVVYIKDWRRSSGCYSTLQDLGNSSEPTLSVPLHDLSRCGMEMKRKVFERKMMGEIKSTTRIIFPQFCNPESKLKWRSRSPIHSTRKSNVLRNV